MLFILLTEITELLKSSTDPDELKHIWVKWRDAVGPKVKSLYKEYVELENESAKLNNFTDNADSWLDSYEAEDFKEQINALWEQLRPLYLQIHGYVRFQLRKKYGDVVSEKGPIPAHLLGRISNSQKYRLALKIDRTCQCVKLFIKSENLEW